MLPSLYALTRVIHAIGFSACLTITLFLLHIIQTKSGMS